MVVIVQLPDPKTWLGAVGYSSLLYATLDITTPLVFLLLEPSALWWYPLPYLVIGWLAGSVLTFILRTTGPWRTTWRPRVAKLVLAACAALLGLLRHTLGGATPNGDFDPLFYFLPLPAMVVCIALTGWFLSR